MWRKLQEAECVDENLQPRMNQTQASILAMAIILKLRIGPGWKPFERLWGMKNLSNFHAAAQDRSYYKEKLKEYEKLLR